MRWKKSNGSLVWVSDQRYLINWNKKAPSKGAQIVKDFLKEYCIKHVLYEEYALPIGRLKVDFLNATKKFAIEFDGQQHNNYVKFFHGNRLGYWRNLKRDERKDTFLEENGYTVIRIVDDDLPLSKNLFEKFNIFF